TDSLLETLACQLLGVGPADLRPELKQIIAELEVRFWSVGDGIEGLGPPLHLLASCGHHGVLRPQLRFEKDAIARVEFVTRLPRDAESFLGRLVHDPEIIRCLDETEGCKREAGALVADA